MKVTIEFNPENDIDEEMAMLRSVHSLELALFVWNMNINGRRMFEDAIERGEDPIEAFNEVLEFHNDDLPVNIDRLVR